MRALRVRGGIFRAAAGVLAVAALISESSQNPSGNGGSAGPAPQIEFYWSLPGGNKASPPSQVAIRGSELQTEAPWVQQRHKRRAVAEEHHRSGHHHHRSELAVSTSIVSEGTAPAAPSSKTPPKNELSAVKDRLRNSLNDELYSDFELFLYVSKAVSGPLAQQMYVFRKGENGVLDLLYDWPVSTGRDRTELNGQGLYLSTFTPTGLFELDPHRFFRHHTSSEWHEPMPFAMFFDWVEGGAPTGLAIHAATGSEIAELGTRASAGCIRLAPEAARTLFNLIQTQYRGRTPRFATDHRTGTMSDTGILLHDANGHAEKSEGYKVLVVIENYSGRNLVAAMY